MNKETKTISRITDGRSLLYQTFHPPILLSDREAYLEASSFIIPKDLALVIILDSVYDEWLGTKIDRDPKTSEMIYGMSMGYIKPLAKDQSLLKFIIHANPKLDFIPEGLIDWGIKLVALPFINFICDMASKLPAFYKECIISDKEHYNRLSDNLSILGEKYGKIDIEKFLEDNFKEEP